LKRNQSKEGPETFKNHGFGGALGVLGGSWGALGAILAHLGPKSQQNIKKSGSLAPLPPPPWSHLGNKFQILFTKNRFLCACVVVVFFSCFLKVLGSKKVRFLRRPTFNN